MIALKYTLNFLHSSLSIIQREIFKDYLPYKMITPQNVSSEAQVEDFFNFVEKLCSILKIFKFLYFQLSHDLQNLWCHDEY